MSEKKQEEQKVVELDRYRQERSESGRSGAEHIWERTVQPLFPGQQSSGQQEARIVKVSSGFGRLKIPAQAWGDTTRCMAA